MTPHQLERLDIRVKNRTGEQRTTCPKCSHLRQKKKDRCLAVNVDADGAKFKCWNCGWTGAVFAHERGAEHRGNTRKPAQIARVYNSSGNEGERAARAISLWREAVHPADTLVETYLRHRGLILPAYASGEAIRFHPHCPFGGERLPCMVALIRDVLTNEPRAIHRTALTADGLKIDRKVFGPKGGGAIKLTPDGHVEYGLTIAEGIETALGGIALRFSPAWAVGDANEIAKFPVLSGIESLNILVDNDVSRTGQNAALECSRRWTAAGREVFRVLPIAAGTDMADVVQGRAA